MADTPTTSTGLKENVASLLCYLGIWVTGIIFYFIEHKNEVIRFHAVQSFVVFGSLFVLDMIFVWLPPLTWIISIIGFILWIFLMVKASKGGKYMLPVAGPLTIKFEQWLINNIKI